MKSINGSAIAGAVALLVGAAPWALLFAYTLAMGVGGLGYAVFALILLSLPMILGGLRSISYARRALRDARVRTGEQSGRLLARAVIWLAVLVILLDFGFLAWFYWVSSIEPLRK